MSYINGLENTHSLGALPTELEKQLKENMHMVERALSKTNELKGLGFLPGKKEKNNLLTFQEVVKKYNKGITREEIEAWVWYKRQQGIPMKGWVDYYLKAGQVKKDLLYAKSTTVVKDNHFRDLRTVPAGAVLGTPTKKSHEYDKQNYLIIRSQDNELLYVLEKNVVRQKTGVSASEKELNRLIKAGALFYLDGEMLPKPIFAFGNIYEKLELLEKDKEVICQLYGEVVYKNHVAVLEDRKPRPLSVADDNPQERPYIAAFSQFAMEYRLNALHPDTCVILEDFYSLQEAFKKWLYSLPDERFKESSAFNISQYHIEGKYPSNRTVQNFSEQRMAESKKAGAKAGYTDREKQNIKKEIREDLKSAAKNEGERLFSEFLYEAIPAPIQQDIDKIWNKLYNGDSEIDYSRIPMGCELSATWNGFPWEMKPVQREGVGFMEVVNSGILAFDVGVGKTLTAIVELAQALYDGKCSKALLCVPDAVYKKWIAELFGQTDKKGNLIKTGILTGTDIVLNEWGNLGVKWQKKIDTSKVPDKSITIVNFGGLVNIGFSNDVAVEFVDELKHVLMQQETDSMTNRDEAKLNTKIEKTIGNIMAKNVAQIDKVGFDYLVIDEAHNFKNVFSTVKKGKNQSKRRFFSEAGTTSERGVKSFFLSNYIQRRYGNNVMLLTATPFTNAPIEVYSMLSLVGYETMKKRNISNLERFFELHVREEEQPVYTTQETLEMKPVVKAFNNRMLLQSLIYNKIMYRTADGEKRPQKVNLPKVNEKKDGRMVRLKASDQVLTYLHMSPMQREVQNHIVKGIENAVEDRRFGKILGFMNKSLNNALSPHIAMKEEPKDCYDFVDNSPKLKYTLESIRTVKQWHEKHGELCSGMIIYINRGKDYFHLLKEWLEKEVGFQRGIDYKSFQKEQGIPESEILDIRKKFDEVEIITGGISPEKKDALKEAFNAGVIKVIIGTSTISEGIDFQRRGTCIFNCYPEYNPTQLRQLEGRIWRFGNPYEYVRIVLPLVQDSMDVFIFQKLEEKTARLNDIWYRSDRGNVLDLDALDPEEVKFALITKVDEIADYYISGMRKETERKIGIMAGNIPMLKEYKRSKARYEDVRQLLLDEIYKVISNLETFDYIWSPPSEKELKEKAKADRDAIKKELKLYEDLKEFKAKGGAVEPMEIANMVQRLHNRSNYFPYYRFVSYSELRMKITRTGNILHKQGFDNTTDVDKVIEQYQQEVEKLRDELSYILSPEHYQKVVDEVKEKKSALAIDGKTVEERVKEFAKLNNLLEYRDAPAQTKKEPNDDDLKLIIAIAEAEAELLELLNL